MSNEFIFGWISGLVSTFVAHFLVLRYHQTPFERGTADVQPLPFSQRSEEEQAQVDQVLRERVPYSDDVPGLGR